MNKFKALVAAALPGVLLLAGCSSDADVASKNLSTAADNFEIERRVIFINGITDKYLLVIEGRCSLGNHDEPDELSVTCKIGDDKFVKHFLHLSDNVTFLVEQTKAEPVSTFHYRVVFKPEEIIPDIDMRTE